MAAVVSPQETLKTRSVFQTGDRLALRGEELTDLVSVARIVSIDVGRGRCPLSPVDGLINNGHFFFRPFAQIHQYIFEEHVIGVSQALNFFLKWGRLTHVTAC